MLRIRWMPGFTSMVHSAYGRQRRLPKSILLQDWSEPIHGLPMHTSGSTHRRIVESLLSGTRNRSARLWPYPPHI
jgi:hypothetical protein